MHYFLFSFLAIFAAQIETVKQDEANSRKRIFFAPSALLLFLSLSRKVHLPSLLPFLPLKVPPSPSPSPPPPSLFG